ncbi:CBS domain-containing protein [Pseudomonas sp. MHK4]|jgi:CBS domain-containing protein
MKTVAQLLAKKVDKHVHTVSPETTVLDALSLMSNHNVGALPVLRNNELVGIVSERDYARKIVLQGRSSFVTAVSNIMTEAVIIIFPMQTVRDCMALMTEHRLRHLPVMNNGQLVGLLSIGDLIKETITDQAALIHQLECYIRGE